MTIKRYTKEEVEKMEDKTDYDKVKNMTEEEIMQIQILTPRYNRNLI